MGLYMGHGGTCVKKKRPAPEVQLYEIHMMAKSKKSSVRQYQGVLIDTPPGQFVRYKNEWISLCLSERLGHVDIKNMPGHLITSFFDLAII